ncbi:hypothetical protein BCR35DRAFT_265101, partial [Leucosporidium creatinivorum]
TLDAPPFPLVPSSVRLDPIVAGTLSSHPHLFNVSSPFHLNKLRRFLAVHPNRPLIDSVLLGLEFGFWPAHSGDFSMVRDRTPHLSDADHAFLASTAQEEYEKGWLSDPFDSLLPGMVVSPTFVVHGKKLRQVVDQSSSGVNDGIDLSFAKTSYDTVRELGALLRLRRLRNQDGSHHTLWKSDVQGAFRNIPVAPEWQLKQVQRVRIIGKLGRPRFIFYVDRRLSLGGRCSPRIFCTVANVIHYAVKIHLGLEYPFIFVNDSFGLDVSGLFIDITHPLSGETRSVPLDQGRVLLAWTLVGMPWVWKKQESSPSALVILGHWVDSKALTITLPTDKKEEFAATVTSFLARRDWPPLIDWQRIAGYAQWACYTLPFAKFALQPLYDKMAGKTKRNAGIPINVDVRRSLTWFVSELLTSPPLSLLDPALDEWSPSDADIEIHTDACGSSDSFDLPGLGFVVLPTRRSSSSPPSSSLHFYHRASAPLGDIQIIEGLAVASAIAWVLKARPAARRILIRTDSAPVVYGFDAGSGSAAMKALVWSTYLQLQAHRVDLRVRHIAGIKNTVADKLSRRHPLVLTDEYSSLSWFSPPAWAFGGALQ